MTKSTDKTICCPLCSNERSEKYRPFCSKRCADIDLNRWLTGQYAIPVEEEEPDDLEMAIEEQLQNMNKLN